MTTATQIVGPAGGGVPSFGAAAIYGRSAIGSQERDDDERRAGRLPGRGPADAGRALPGRPEPGEPGRAPSASNVVRLPGQEGPSPSGPPRPLIGGGAFTLAVAIGLSLDRQATPDSLERAGPASFGEDAAASESEEAAEEGIDGLTEEEREQVRELQQRDAEVRRHEAAHAAAGGEFAGAPTFTYQTGPDGKRYAVGGSVSIDTSPVKGDPEATIRKAQQIRTAANAPANPSAQDRRIAAQADAMRQQAQVELQAQNREERQAEEAERQAAEAERAARQQDGGQPTQDAGAEAAGFGLDGGDPNPQPAEDDAAGPAGIAAAGETPAPAAFSGATASYRGPVSTPTLVSIAV